MWRNHEFCGKSGAKLYSAQHITVSKITLSYSAPSTLYNWIYVFCFSVPKAFELYFQAPVHVELLQSFQNRSQFFFSTTFNESQFDFLQFLFQPPWRCPYLYSLSATIFHLLRQTPSTDIDVAMLNKKLLPFDLSASADSENFLFGVNHSFLVTF